MNTPSIQIYPDTAALTLAAADHIITLANTAIGERGRFTLALSGGSTPKPVYERLATQRDRIDWTKAQLFWGDERTVPPNHADSNYHLAYETLLKHIEHECGNIQRLRGELDPTLAAAEYETKLRASFPGEALPRFDLMLQGMGDDGHTASLFPHTAALHERERLVVANYVEKLQTWRLTFTVPLINAARQVTFLIAGANKADPLYEVLHGKRQPEVYPSQLIQPVDGHLTLMVDAAAAAKLPQAK